MKQSFITRIYKSIPGIKKMKALLYLLLLMNSRLSAQNVGINATGTPPNASAILDIDVSGIVSTKLGLLIPRVTSAQRVLMNPLPAAAQGLMVYQTNGVEGIYYNTSLTVTPTWIYVANNTSTWNLSGNSGTNPATQFLGTTDAQPVIFKVNSQRSGFIDYNNAVGTQNMSLGYQALMSNTMAGSNTAIGYQALLTQSFNNGGSSWDTYNVAVGNGALYNNQPTSIFDGAYNTSIGSYSMYNNSSGYYSTAVGTKALFGNTIGARNTAIGMFALSNNTTGSENTALGYHALSSQSFNNGGILWTSYNTAVGSGALDRNQPTSTSNGINNTAVGYQPLFYNTTGTNNTAVGSFVLFNNLTAGDNVAIGHQALYTQSYSNSNLPYSSKNIAIGNGALFANQPTTTFSGINNIAIGYFALNKSTTANFNVAIGTTAMANTTTGFDNTATGTNALNANTTGSYNTANGMNALFSNTIGQGNIAIGIDALHGNTSAGFNTAVGYNALVNQSFNNGGVIYGSNNVAIGQSALINNQPTSTLNGINNTGIGTNSLTTNTIGFNNTALGYQADVSIINLSNATAIGYNAKVSASNSLVLGGTAADAVNVGIGITAPVYKLDISDRIRLREGLNSAGLWLFQTTPNADRGFIGMEDDNHMGFYGSTAGWGLIMDVTNGNMGFGCLSPQYKLHVIGDIASSATIRSTNAVITGAITACSDARYKKNIEPLKNALTNLMKLRGVNYYWKTKEFPDKYFNSKKQIGVVAQELEKVYPELVMTDKDGSKSVDYSKITPVLIEAIKEQQQQIDEYKKRMEASDAKVDKLLERITKLEHQAER